MTEQVTTPCQCTPLCTPESKWVNNLEFRVSTWCNTPRPWNERGAWLQDDESMNRIKNGLRKASDLNALQTVIDGYQDYSSDCGTFWGSHGCNLAKGHKGTWHLCGAPDDPCMAVAEWGDQSLIAWHVEGPQDEWEPWGLHWEAYEPFGTPSDTMNLTPIPMLPDNQYTKMFAEEGVHLALPDNVRANISIDLDMS